MPSIFTVAGYKIYFWSNENNEPVHIHIAKGKPTHNSTKYWVTSGGGLLQANNNSRIPKKDLVKLESYIQSNIYIILNMWKQTFGYLSWYC